MRTLYCGFCGLPAVFGDAVTACVSCRSLWFRTEPMSVRPSKFVMTAADRRFLRSLRIEADGEETRHG